MIFLKNFGVTQGVADTGKSNSCTMNKNIITSEALHALCLKTHELLTLFKKMQWSIIIKFQMKNCAAISSVKSYKPTMQK